MWDLPASWTTVVYVTLCINIAFPHFGSGNRVDSVQLFVRTSSGSDNCRDRLCGIFSEGDKRDSKHGIGEPMTLPRSQRPGLGPERSIVTRLDLLNISINVW